MTELIELDKEHMLPARTFSSINSFKEYYKIGHNISGSVLKSLNTGAIVNFGGKHLVRKDVWETGDAHLTEHLITAKLKVIKDQEVKERRRGKEIFVLDKKFIIIDSFRKMPLKRIASRFNFSEGNLKSLLSKTPGRIRKALDEQNDLFYSEHHFLYLKDLEELEKYFPILRLLPRKGSRSEKD